METNQLNIFTAVYRLKSFTRASEMLHISQPTISEHIKNLESKLGCKLFDRLGRSIQPTMAAEILYPRALEILDGIDRLFADINATHEKIAGELHIGASTIPGTYILPEIAAGFKREHPDTAFQISIDDSQTITESVLNHELLVGIVGAKIIADQLEFEPVFADELVLAAATKNAINKTIGITELPQFPFLLREQGSGTRQCMEEMLRHHRIVVSDLNIVAVLGSTASIKEAIKANMGVSILSRLAIRDEIACMRLREIQVTDIQMHRQFYIVTHKKRTLPIQYLEFMAHMKKNRSLTA